MSPRLKMKKIYDCRTERQEFSPGDQVLALLPMVGSPFQRGWWIKGTGCQSLMMVFCVGV